MAGSSAARRDRGARPARRAARSRLRPRATSSSRARAIVEAHGEDSLSPFILRPDKSFAFAAGGVIAYRMIGRTAVVSGDPVGPAGAVAALCAQLREKRARAGGRVVLYGCFGAPPRGLPRSLGLRAICVGEEAVVDPEPFTLEGRRGPQAAPVGPPGRAPRLAGSQAREGREIDARLRPRSTRSRPQLALRADADARVCDGDGRVRARRPRRRPVPARPFAGGRARRGDAVSRRTAGSCRWTRCAASARPRTGSTRRSCAARSSRPRARRRRGQPQLRRARRTSSASEPTAARATALRGTAFACCSVAISRWSGWCASTRSSRPSGGRATSSTSPARHSRARSCACSRPRDTCAVGEVGRFLATPPAAARWPGRWARRPRDRRRTALVLIAMTVRRGPAGRLLGYGA